MIKIFFDMDGVLADFNKGVEELCGFDRSDRDKWKASGNDDEMWVGIREVDHFYDKLDPMPGAIEMFERIYGKYPDHCGILTGIPKPKRGILTAGEDKTTWVRRLLSEDIPVNIVIREEKPDFCTGKDCILIDDLKGNIEEWEKSGGTGILHESPEKTIRRLQEMGIL